MSTKCTVALFDRNDESWHLYYDQSDERHHLDYTFDGHDGTVISMVIPDELIAEIRSKEGGNTDLDLDAIRKTERDKGFKEAMKYAQEKVFDLSMEMDARVYGFGRARGHPYTVDKCNHCPALRQLNGHYVCKVVDELIEDPEVIPEVCPLRTLSAIEIKLSTEAKL